jgi:hypothetical protein
MKFFLLPGVSLRTGLWDLVTNINKMEESFTLHFSWSIYKIMYSRVTAYLMLYQNFCIFNFIKSLTILTIK